MKRTHALAAGASALAVAFAALPAHAEPVDTHTFTRNTTALHVTAKAATAKAATANPGTANAATADRTAAAAVLRIAGLDRIGTALEASSFWPDAGAEGAASAVVLSRSDQYADALGGSALAGAAGGPLLLTSPDQLRAEVGAEIDRLLGGAGTVYLLGGPKAISVDVENALDAAGYSVTRLDGVDRYETSVVTAKETAALSPGGQTQLVFATTGRNFPDGLAAGATAAGYWGAVVLTRDDQLPGPVATYLDELAALEIPMLAVGGAAAAAPGPWLDALVGRDRYETAQIVAESFWGSTDLDSDDPVVIGLATGLDWPDALSGGAFVAGGGPLVLSRKDSLPGSTSAAVTTLVSSAEPSTVELGVLFGGPVAVTDTVLDEFDALLNPAP
ncbi:cell wall-binding repeat-containing protein [Intrasporangium sp.]|uniref:cell wall-binding repeat-containing protein n=1 Tax=Intrasporangium sp. TaxID=1925024 RepID=UPI002939F580|nr:cell wall-binding repeat-containing protein [Intrasporangium sp.]MDV3220820.1 cell wall-binding repeat-containing protein [Intrasporangium sp.]